MHFAGFNCRVAFVMAFFVVMLPMTPARPEPGCLPDDSAVPILKTAAGLEFVRTPDNQFTKLPDFPYAPHYVEVGGGLRMHYIDEGPADGELVLLMHGQPTWSYLYRKMIPGLVAAGRHVIAVDLIGLGRSDKPIALEAYTYAQHVAWAHEFVTAKDLKNITLFCQDWGSLIGLRLAGDMPERFARIVAANATFPVSPTGATPYKRNPSPKIDCSMGDFPPAGWEALGQVARFQSWIDYCLSAPNFRPHQVIEVATEVTLSEDEARAYDAPYPSFIYKAGIRSFPACASAIPMENIPAWAALGKFDRPFLTLWGAKDQILGAETMQNALVNHIPGSKGQPHERLEANHFIQEDIGEILAQRVNAFIEKNPRR